MRRALGYSLLELLVVVALLAAIATLGAAVLGAPGKRGGDEQVDHDNFSANTAMARSIASISLSTAS